MRSWLTRLRPGTKQPLSTKARKARQRKPFAPLFETLEARFAMSAAHLVHPNLVWTHAGTSSTPSGFTPAQIRAAYGFDKIKFGTIVGDGTGQTIAIVDAYHDPNIVSDLATFDAQFGIKAPPSFKIVNQTGGTTLPRADAGWAGEIALDVEWAHAIAPGANILLVEAKSAYDTDLNAALDYARKASGVVVVSCSWGGAEYGTEAADDVHYTTPAGHAGVTFTIAAGDDGTGAEYPSSSPNVLSVGGTNLRTSGGLWSSETVWTGGGGGQSRYENVPTWQAGLGLTKRGTPDVAYNADPNTGFAVYDTYGDTGWGVVGGTSAGAPQWAALIAIVDQGRSLAGKSSLGNAQAALYSIARTDFHDITAGSNGKTATVGYDVSSGLGSPIANLVVADLVAYGGGGTTTTTLAAPTLSSLTAASSTSAKLTWTTIAGATGYRVLQVVNGTNVVVGTFASTATTATVTGLTAGSTVTFKIQAYNSTASATSAAKSITLPAAAPLAAPTITYSGAASATTAKISWNAVSGATGYRILKIQNGVATTVLTVSATTTTATISNLTAGTSNTFKVEAYNSTSLADSVAVTIAQPAPIVLAAPVVTGIATSSTTANLSWSTVSGAAGYRIYQWDGYDVVLIGTVGADTTSVDITGLDYGSDTDFLVEAYGSGKVADSDWVTVSTPWW